MISVICTVHFGIYCTGESVNVSESQHAPIKNEVGFPSENGGTPDTAYSHPDR